MDTEIDSVTALKDALDAHRGASDFCFSITMKDGSKKATVISAKRSIDAWLDLLHLADLEDWQVKNISINEYKDIEGRGW